jgi:alkylation response protein AidB-like acyl-CoA dehydrogenase
MTSLEDPALLSFREEVRTFCATSLPGDIRRKVELGLTLEKDDYVRWQKILHRRGWIVGHWPKEHGGCDWTPLQRHIFEEETTQSGAPWLTPFGVNYVGPIIYTFGNEAQRRKYLPGILSTDTWWCQGYSEPDAGSDLASVSMTARRDGDCYRLNGRKIWTTMAQWADMMFCLARTSREDRPQKGISFLLVNMKAPGVTVRPIVTLDECHHLNEVLFEDVEVPLSDLIGEEGKGWTYAKFLLANERVLVAEVGKIKRMLRGLREFARLMSEGGRSLLDDDTFAGRMARCEIDLRVLEALCMKQLGEAEGAEPGVEASILKIRGSELQQAVAQLSLDAIARRGLPFSTDALAGDAQEEASVPEGTSGIVREYLFQRATTIYGGSNEIQRNIIAKAGLDL